MVSSALMREVENDWIPMPDGVRLAVSLWLPETAAPAPVVLEYIPYRKRDLTYPYARFWGRRLAQCGIAYARVDCRGSGDSGGVLVDEYLSGEQADAARAIAWLAAQPWCNGAVGMRGVSWGGFAALQVAALAPPALKAIMPACASDRRFTDDAHFVGGALALTGLKWATTFRSVMASPPDPAVFGPGWEAAWRERLEAVPAIAARWLAHQREDAYWRHASVAFDPGAIRCPVYLVGGWADPYSRAMLRLLPRLEAPAKAVFGPWGHGYPAQAAPGPGLMWIDEESRWWRHWLLGEATGVMDGPRVWVFMPRASPAQSAGGTIPGHWVAEDAWPPRTRARSLPLAKGAKLEMASSAGVGLQTPEWCPFAAAQFPEEQSPDDARSLVFEIAALKTPLEILGAPRLRLRLASSAPVAQLAARLNEVTADGRAWPITYGVLNLTHRHGPAAPEPMPAGEMVDVELELYPMARRLGPGSRLRLALSAGLWPLIWPAPAPFTLTLEAARLDLPIRQPRPEAPAMPMALPPESPGGAAEGPHIERHADGGLRFSETWPQSEVVIVGVGTSVSRGDANVEASFDPTDPASCRWRAWRSSRFHRDDWDCALMSEIEITADADAFHVRERLEARQAGELIFTREDASDIPRDLM